MIYILFRVTIYSYYILFGNSPYGIRELLTYRHGLQSNEIKHWQRLLDEYDKKRKNVFFFPIGNYYTFDCRLRAKH